MNDAFIHSLNHGAAFWAQGMGRACWQGGLFILGIGVLCRLCPRLPASLRCTLWWLACLKLLIGLAWTAPLTLALLPAASPAPASNSPAPIHLSPDPFRESLVREPVAPGRAMPLAAMAASQRGATLPALAFATDRSATGLPDRPHLSLFAVLLGLWLIGLLIRLLFLIRRSWSIYRLARTARPLSISPLMQEAAHLAARLGLRRLPCLHISDQIACPAVIGLLRPTVLLAQVDLDRLSAIQLRMALAHELAHVRQGDLWRSLIPTLVQSLFFFNPLAWLASREFAIYREAACDAMALDATGQSPDAYGQLLLQFVVVGGSRRFAGELRVVSGYRSLQRRLLMLQHISPEARRRLRVGLAALSIIAWIALVPWRVVAAPDAAPNPLAGDMRLAQKVAIRAEGIPVGDLLASLSRKTGVTLAADASVADDKVVILGPARPLKEVLSDLATLFNDVWARRKTGDGPDSYLLMRDLRARHYEDDLAQNATQRMVTQLDAYIQAASETPEQLAKRPENDPIRHHFTAGNEITAEDESFSGDQNRLAARLVGLLSPEQRERLLTCSILKFPFEALTLAQQETVRRAFDEMVDASEAQAARYHRDHPDESQSFARHPEELEKFGLCFAAQNFQSDARPDASSGSVGVWACMGKSLVGMVGTLQSRAFWLLPPHGNPYTRQPVSSNALLPALHFIREALNASSAAWIDRLGLLAEKAGVPILADYYRSIPVARPQDDPFAATSLPFGGEASQALDALCRTDGSLWWMQGKSLLLRKRLWYLQRQYEIPDRWMRDLTQRLKAQNGFPTYADVLRLGALTTEQIAGNMDGMKTRSGGASTNLFTDRWHMAGLPELLALLKERPSPQGSNVPIPDQLHLKLDQMANLLSYNDLTLNQKALLPRFAAATSEVSSLTEPALEKFKVYFSLYGEPPAPTADAVHIFILYEAGNHGSYGLSLPITLPDDRRDKTEIELVP